MAVQTISTTDFAKKYPQVASIPTGAPILITNRNKPDTVVIKYQDLKTIKNLVTKIEDKLERERIKRVHDAFVKRVLKAAEEPIENDVVIETEEDNRKFFGELKKRVMAKKYGQDSKK